MLPRKSPFLQQKRNKHSILNWKLEGGSCIINHESNPKVKQCLLQKVTLWNFSTTGLDQEANFLSFTWEVNTDSKCLLRDESFRPASDKGLGHLFVSGIYSALDYNWAPRFVQTLSGNSWFVKTKTRSLNPTELTGWVITGMEQSQKAENIPTVQCWDIMSAFIGIVSFLELLPTVSSMNWKWLWFFIFNSRNRKQL